jgi:uroporphyrinogen III methyltransferase/synthase
LSEDLKTRHVVVTRDESAEGPLSSLLRSLGLAVLLWPAVTVTSTRGTELQKALEAPDLDWIVFASRHAVAAVTERLAAPPTGVRIAAIGHSTAHALKQHGWRVDLVPEEANAAALVSAFASSAGTPGKVLYPASSRALPTIALGLAQLGAQVIQVEAYSTGRSTLDAESCRGFIARDAIAAVTFASPSAVIELEGCLGKADFDRLLTSAAAVAIGPTTARALGERGHAAVLAQSSTLEGLALTTLQTLQTRH